MDCAREEADAVLAILGIGEQWNSYGTRSITVLMECASLWKVDATEAPPEADLDLKRFP